MVRLLALGFLSVLFYRKKSAVLNGCVRFCAIKMSILCPQKHYNITVLACGRVLLFLLLHSQIIVTLVKIVKLRVGQRLKI